MNKPRRNARSSFFYAAQAFLSLAATVFLPSAAQAGIDATYTGHDYVSVTSAVSVTELQAVRFGNFAVGSPGTSVSSLTMTDTGTRSVSNTGTTISLLNGGSGSDVGSQGPGIYEVTGAGATANVYVSFTDHTGAAISSSNPVVLTGPPGSGTFNVYGMNFNQSGTDANGAYIVTDSSGTAYIEVGATLYTVSGVSTYAPGTYRGTFDLVLSY